MNRFLAALVLSCLLHVIVSQAVRSRLVAVAHDSDRAVCLEVSSLEPSDAEILDETARPAPAPTPVATAAQRLQQVEQVPEEGPLPPDVPPEVVAEPDDLHPEEPPPQVVTPPSESPAPRQGKVEAPVRLRRAIRPDYPRAAKSRGEEGTVTLEVIVNERGTVDSVRVTGSSGSRELDRAAERAVKEATFEPATCDGHPIAACVVIPIVFRLR